MVRLSVCPLEYWEVDLRNFLYWTNAKTEKEITKKSYKRSVFFVRGFEGFKGQRYCQWRSISMKDAFNPVCYGYQILNI